MDSFGQKRKQSRGDVSILGSVVAPKGRDVGRPFFPSLETSGGGGPLTLAPSALIDDFSNFFAKASSWPASSWPNDLAKCFAHCALTLSTQFQANQVLGLPVPSSNNLLVRPELGSSSGSVVVGLEEASPVQSAGLVSPAQSHGEGSLAAYSLISPSHVMDRNLVLVLQSTGSDGAGVCSEQRIVAQGGDGGLEQVTASVDDGCSQPLREVGILHRGHGVLVWKKVSHSSQVDNSTRVGVRVTLPSLNFRQS